MLIEIVKGFDFSFADFKSWTLEEGFRGTFKIYLTGPLITVVGIKQMNYGYTIKRFRQRSTGDHGPCQL